MINYIRKKIRKRKLKSTFKEYGYEVRTFQLDGIGEVEYAQWLHPFEKPKEISNSNVQFYRRLAAEGGMIIDVGAHTGDTTVPMALAVGREGLVLGLEPNQYVYKILEKNASLNPAKTNIVPLCLAATEQEGTFTFNYSDASFCNGGFLSQIETNRHRHQYTLDVHGVNLQSYLLEHYPNDLSRLDLIKVDAEGYDKEILKTLPQILETYKPNLMIECYKRLNTHERHELFEVVTRFGYNLYHLENFEMFDKLAKIEKSNMTYQKHFEMLAVHSDRQLNL